MDSLKKTILLAALFLFCACSSEAERVARYCTLWDEAVRGAANCEQMAQQVGELNGAFHGYVWGGAQDVCAQTTACLPCKAAAREMLARCAQDGSFAQTLGQFHVSRLLRETAAKALHTEE